VVVNVVQEVSGELAGLLDQVAEVVGGDPVEHPAAVAAGVDQAGEAQPPEVLRHRRPGGGDLGGEGGHVLLPFGEQDQQVQAGGVGQMPQSRSSARYKLLDPQPITHVGVVLAAGVIGFLGNELVAVYRIRIGRKIGSAALVADGLHARTDGFTSLAVVAAALGVLLGFPLADPIVGLLITVAILFVLRGAATDIYRRLMDGVDSELVDTADVEKVMAHPHARGLGLGRLIVDALISNARAAEIETLALGVRGNNHGAIEIYEQLGFREWGRHPNVIEIGDERYDDVCMTLDLGRKPHVALHGSAPAPPPAEHHLLSTGGPRSAIDRRCHPYRA
jgi:ribosomal protein S18 acetylase RimI-like enzyme